MKRILLVLSMAALMAAMLVASVSPALAIKKIPDPGNNLGGGGGEVILTKEMCKDTPGFAALGFMNQGQCVKAANHGATVPGDDGSDIGGIGGGVSD